MNKFFSRGIAAIANLFAPAFGRIRVDYSEFAKSEAEATTETTKRSGGYSGAKLERKAAKGRVGMATLR